MSAPRVKLYKAVDDNDFAAVFIGPNGKPLPVFYLAAGKTDEEARDNAVTWWNQQHEKAAAKGKRPDPAPKQPEPTAPEPSVENEDIFG